MIENSLLKRNVNFRYLWYAQSGSYLGDWFNQVAITQTVLILTNSPAVVGAISGALSLLCGISWLSKDLSKL